MAWLADSPVGTFVITLTTTIRAQVDITADGRQKIIAELLKKVQKRHKHFLEEMLPTAVQLEPDEPDFQNSNHTSLMLATCQTRLDGIADKLASGGILFRLAPNSLRGEMDRLKQDVLEVDENTRRTSIAASTAIEELITGKRKKVIVRSETNEGGLTELEISLASVCQAVSEGSN